MLLFVYGTLKRGFHNNRILETSEFVGEAVTRQKYVLFRAGFPVMMESKKRYLADQYWRPVQGEVYNVTRPEAWARLDALEGVPYMYLRGKATVTNLYEDDPTDVETETYIGNPEMWYNRFTEHNFERGLCAVENEAYYYE